MLYLASVFNLSVPTSQGIGSQVSRTTWALQNGSTDTTFSPEGQVDEFHYMMHRNTSHSTHEEGNNYVSIGSDAFSDNNMGFQPETFAADCTLMGSPGVRALDLLLARQ